MTSGQRGDALLCRQLEQTVPVTGASHPVSRRVACCGQMQGASQSIKLAGRLVITHTDAVSGWVHQLV
jgi:hypothetical protein